MAPKVVIIMGAPESKSLDWDSDELLNDFVEPVARFAGIYKPPQSPNAVVNRESALDIALWRSVPLERRRLATGYSQVHVLENEYQGDQNFFSALSTASGDTQNVAASQSLLEEFYQHSLAVHDDVNSSQLPLGSRSTERSSMTSLDSSMEKSTEYGTALFIDGQDARGEPKVSHLSDLEDLPHAKYLVSIAPQTLTVNIIVGIISVAEPRTVKTRWGRTCSLIELLVGDETKAGFSITFWLADEHSAQKGVGSQKDYLLKSLRRQDIVLLRNVALSHFKDKVHGYSLRKGLTAIDLLYRRKMDDKDMSGFYSAKDLASNRYTHPQLAKTRRVREWVLQFVGGDRVHLGKRKEQGKTIRSWELPPDDDSQIP